MAQKTSSTPKRKTNGARKMAGLDRLFRPRSVAVIGASRREGSIGREVLRNLVEGGFAGKVFPVNPKTDVGAIWNTVFCSQVARMSASGATANRFCASSRVTCPTS